MPVFLDDIGNHLIAQGIVEGSTGWTLKQSFMPSLPDKMVAIFETSGEDPGIPRDMAVEHGYDKPGFQVRVRGEASDYAAVRAKIQEIFVALHQNEPTPGTDTYTFVYIYAVSSGPLPMGIDASDRVELSWNFRTMLERV